MKQVGIRRAGLVSWCSSSLLGAAAPNKGWEMALARFMLEAKASDRVPFLRDRGCLFDATSKEMNEAPMHSEGKEGRRLAFWLR